MNVHDRCVACGSNQLLRVPPTPGNHSHIVTGHRVLRTVSVATYVCTACGRVEQWVNSKDELARLQVAWAEDPRRETAGGQ